MPGGSYDVEENFGQGIGWSCRFTRRYIAPELSFDKSRQRQAVAKEKSLAAARDLFRSCPAFRGRDQPRRAAVYSDS
jgi:hypothetical protein